MWNSIVGIFLFIVLVTILRDEYVRRKYGSLVKSIKKIHSNAYLSIIWLFIAIMNFPEGSLIEIIVPLILMIFYLITGLRRNIISGYGVITHHGKFKWSRIMNYEWSNKIHKKRNKEYYILKFIVKGSRFSKLIYGSDEEKISLKISKDDRGKLEQYLENILENKRIA